MNPSNLPPGVTDRMIEEQAGGFDEPAAPALLTGSTCGDLCWHAREETCRCSCAGRNHGILKRGGAQPNRTAKIGGEFFELVAVIPGRGQGECWNDAYRRVNAEVASVCAERFPGLDLYGYGRWRQASTVPVLDRKLSPAQTGWPEVVAVPDAFRLVWARPAGSRYIVRCSGLSSVWSDAGTEGGAG